MKRQLINKLRKWKASPYRKPLLLMGVRQVGKTTLIGQFGKTAYENMVSINFEEDPELKKLFEADLKPDRIIRDIELELNTKILPGKTLLFFDEIQEAPNALNSLKYFNEQTNEYHVCGAGSLLGVKLSHTKGFPVGKVHFETLHPLTYIEFLNAIGQERLASYLSELTLQEKISPLIHDKALNYVKIYLFTGGMPEAVSRYRDTEDYDATRTVHKNILNAYDLDFIKHAPRSLMMRITETFHSISSQLAKENKKFIYSIIRTGARARNYEDAIQWLLEAGLIYKIYQISTPKLPIKAYQNRNFFKTYPVDVGLLNTMTNLTPKMIIDNHRLFQEFHGALTESFVAQELKPHNETLHYWTSEGRAEIDFILQMEDAIHPLEVKSGFTKQKKSLQLYQEKYQPKFILRTSPNNLEYNGDFINIPLYLVGQLNRLLKE